MRLIKEHCKTVAYKVVTNTIASKIETQMLEIRQMATDVYLSELDQRFRKVAEALIQDNVTDYVKTRTSIQIDNWYPGYLIGEFKEANYSGSQLIRSSVSPLKTFINQICDVKYGRRNVTSSFIRRHLSITLMKKVPDTCNSNTITKKMDWSPLKPKIKLLSENMKAAEKLFCEVYEFLKQFTTYDKAMAEWPDLPRYLAKNEPTRTKNIGGALVKTGKSLDKMIKELASV